MVMGCSVEKIFKFLGHDGSEIIWPELKEPLSRHSFGFNEMMYFCWHEGWITTIIETVMYCKPVAEVEPLAIRLPEEWLTTALTDQNGVLTGLSLNGNAHAVAWNCDERLCYDPNGTKYGIDNFNVSVFIGLRVD